MASNRSKQIWIGLTAAILGGLAVLIYVESSNHNPGVTQFNRKEDPAKPPRPLWENLRSETAAKRERPRDSLTDDTRVRTSFPKPTLENPPPVAQVREQVEEDTHSTPQSLVEFAEQMALNMESAFADSGSRYNVSRQLIACARDGNSKGAAQAARALCLANLERLKEKFPEELAPSYQSLLAELPDDLLFVAGVSRTAEGK